MLRSHLEAKRARQRREEEDRMVQKASKSRECSMNSSYSTLELEGEVSFPSKISVRLLGSYQSGFLQIGCGMERILTMNQLKRRGQFLASYCCMFKKEELVDHLLIHCGKVRGLCTFLFSYLAFPIFSLIRLKIG